MESRWEQDEIRMGFRAEGEHDGSKMRMRMRMRASKMGYIPTTYM